MSTFLQTNLPEVVWASLLAVVIALYVLKGGKRRSLRSGGPSVLAALVTLLRVVVAAVLIAAGVGSFLAGRKLQEFPILSGRDTVGVVQILWTRGDSAAMLNMSRTDDPLARGEELVQIPGLAWAVHAQVIRWPSWGSVFGLRPIYRLEELVAWDRTGKGQPQFVLALPHSKLATWNAILTYGPFLPGFPPIEKMVSRTAVAAEYTIYRIVVSPEGLEIHEEHTRPASLVPAPAEDHA